MMSEQARQSREEGPRFGLDIPVLILALAFFVWTAFQTFELIKQSSQLSAARASQEQPLQELAKVQSVVQSMGADTLKLADGGNATAKEVLDGFAKQGVKFGPPPAKK